MDVKAALEWCDQIITEVDIELMQWQQALDNMVFAGMEIPLVLVADGETYEIGTARLKHDDGALKSSFEILSIDKDYLPVVASLGEHTVGYDPGPPARVFIKPRPAKPMTHYTLRRDGSFVNNFTGVVEVPPKEERWNLYDEALRNNIGNYRGGFTIDDPHHRDEESFSDLDTILNDHPFFKKES